MSNGGGNVRLSRKTHAHSTSHGSGAKQVDVVSQTSAPQAGKDPVIVNDGTTGATSWSPPNGPVQPPVKLDPAGARGSDGNWHPVTLKEMKVCVKNADGSNTQRTMICLCSNVYQGVGDPN